MAEKREITQEDIRARLETLRMELEKGQVELQKVEAQRTYLHETILRIEGAIQLLNEFTDGYPAEQRGIVPSETGPVSEPTGTTPGVP
jgi:hypothetical protein